MNLEKRFSIVSETSRGSMSKVFRALDNQTGKTVCLKVQSREKNEAATARASASERRPFEGEMAIHLVHPHIVRTFEYGSTNRGEHFLVMEFIDGVSFQFVRETRSARTAEKVELLAQGAEGLAALHAAGLSITTSTRGIFWSPRSAGQADRLRPEHSQPARVLRAGQPHRDGSVHGPRAACAVRRSTNGSTFSPSGSWRSSF